MTMKRLLYIAFFSGLLLSVSTSCNDLFKEVPYDKLSENAIWGDQLLLDEYVLPWYRNMDNGFSTYVTTIMKGIGREYEPWYADQMTVSRPTRTATITDCCALFSFGAPRPTIHRRNRVLCRMFSIK